MRHTYRFIGYSLLMLAVVSQLGCGSLAMESKWCDREIVIDGKSDDWVGLLQYFEKKNVSVGMLNDDSFFYMCLIIDQQQLSSQIMAQGLRLWFDPEGDDNKRFGIKYPIGLGNWRPNREVTEEDRERMQDPERRQEIFENSLAQLEILSAGSGNGLRMAIEEAKGIEIGLQMYSGQVVYECKIPLLTSEGMPYVIKAQAGDAIGVGLESSRPEMQAQQARMGGAAGGGGKGGGMRGGGGMTGSGRGGAGMPGAEGRGGGRNSQMPEELEVWASVQLATK